MRGHRCHKGPHTHTHSHTNSGRVSHLLSVLLYQCVRCSGLIGCSSRQGRDEPLRKRKLLYNILELLPPNTYQTQAGNRREQRKKGKRKISYVLPCFLSSFKSLVIFAADNINLHSLSLFLPSNYFACVFLNL